MAVCSSSSPEAAVDPLFEVDAPKFFDFASELQKDSSSVSSEGDSWFERKAEEEEEVFETNKGLLVQLEDPADEAPSSHLSEDKREDDPSDAVLVPVPVAIEEQVASADETEAPAIQEDLVLNPPPRVVESKEVESCDVEVVKPPEEVECNKEQTLAATKEEPEPRDLENMKALFRRGRDRRKKRTAGSRDRTTATGETVKPPLVTLHALGIKTHLQNKAQALGGGAQVPLMVKRYGTEAPHKSTQAKPFRFATDRRMERRSASVPRHNQDPQHKETEDKDAGKKDAEKKWSGFQEGLRNYAPSPSVRHLHATIPKPFHFHEMRKRSSSVDRSTGRREEDQRGSPKKRPCKLPPGTAGVGVPKVGKTTKPHAPMFATDKRLEARREHSMERHKGDPPRDAQDTPKQAAETRGRSTKKSLNPQGLFKMDRFKKEALKKTDQDPTSTSAQAPIHHYQGPTLRSGLGGGRGGSAGQMRTEEKILKEKQDREKAIDEEARKLRQLTVFKAQPIKKYPPVDIKHDTMKVTTPVSPTFHTRSRENQHGGGE